MYDDSPAFGARMRFQHMSIQQKAIAGGNANFSFDQGLKFLAGKYPCLLHKVKEPFGRLQPHLSNLTEAKAGDAAHGKHN
ncbi:hypothetical protein D3C73_650290 [compost metagenome]